MQWHIFLSNGSWKNWRPFWIKRTPLKLSRYAIRLTTNPVPSLWRKHGYCSAFHMRRDPPPPSQLASAHFGSFDFHPSCSLNHPFLLPTFPSSRQIVSPFPFRKLHSLVRSPSVMLFSPFSAFHLCCRAISHDTRRQMCASESQKSSSTSAASSVSAGDSGRRTPPTRSIRSLDAWKAMGEFPTQRPPLSGPSSCLYAVEPTVVPRQFPLTAAPPRLPRGSWWRYFRRTLLPWEWRLLGMGGGAGIAACCLGHLFIPWYFAVLMDGVCGGELRTGTSSLLIALFVVVLIGQVVRLWSVQTTESSVSARLRRELYDTILSDPQWRQGEGVSTSRTPQAVEGGHAFSTSSLVQRLSLDCQQVSQSLTTSLSSLVYHVIFGLGAVGMMTLLSSPLAVAIVGLIVPGFIFSGVYGRYYKATQRSCRATSIAWKAVAEERLAWKEQIQLWHTQEKESAWFGVMVGRHLYSTLHHQRWGAVYEAVVNFVIYGGCLCMMWAGSLLVASQRLTHGGLLAMIVYSGYGMWSAIGVVQSIHEINKGYASWIRLWEVMDHTKDVDTKKEKHTAEVQPNPSSVHRSSTGPTSPLSGSSPSSSFSSSLLLDVSLHHIAYPSTSHFSSSSLLLRDVTCPLFPPSSRPAHRPCVTCVVAESASTLSAVAAVLLERFPPTLEHVQRSLFPAASDATRQTTVETKEGNAEASSFSSSSFGSRDTKPAPPKGGDLLEAPLLASQTRGSGHGKGDTRHRQEADHWKERHYRYGTLQLSRSSSPGVILRDPISFPDFSASAFSARPLRSSEGSSWAWGYVGPVHTTMVLEGSVKENILYGTSDGEWGGGHTTCPATPFFSPSRGANAFGGGPRHGFYPSWMQRETGVGTAVLSLMQKRDLNTGMQGRDHWLYARVVEAAMKAEAHSFVTHDLLHGYDTILLGRRRPAWCSRSHPLFSSSLSSPASASDMAVLSDGQTQLLGLSRALLRQPVLLVLDQPTEALDNSWSYAMVLSAVQNLCSPVVQPLLPPNGTLSSSSSSSLCSPLQKAARAGYPQGILLCSNDRSLVHLAQHVIVLGNDTNEEGGATVVAQGSVEDVKHHPVFCRAVR